MSGKTYVEISRVEMMDYLGRQGFEPVHVEGTKELVMGKRVDVLHHDDRPMTLRVYTSIDGYSGRECGKDAIRVCLVAKDDRGKIVGVGRSKRVNRVAGWEDRLTERIESWEILMGPKCSSCGAETKERKGKFGKFWGCINYPTCKGKGYEKEAK